MEPEMDSLDPTERLLRSSRETLSPRARQEHLLLLAQARVEQMNPAADVADYRIRPRRRKYVVGGAAAVAALMLGGGVAAAWVQSLKPTAPAMVHCFAVATQTPGEDPGLFQPVALLADENGTLMTPENACAGYWRAGLLSQEPPHVRTDPDGGALEGRRSVPQMVSCVLPEGNVGVFPNARCIDLRLPDVAK